MRDIPFFFHQGDVVKLVFAASPFVFRTIQQGQYALTQSLSRKDEGTKNPSCWKSNRREVPETRLELVQP